MEGADEARRERARADRERDAAREAAPSSLEAMDANGTGGGGGGGGAAASSLPRGSAFGKKSTYLFAFQIRAALQRLWVNEREILDLLYGSFRLSGPQAFVRSSHWSLFLFELLPVPPNRFRPMAMRDGAASEHPANISLKSILKVWMRSRVGCGGCGGLWGGFVMVSVVCWSLNPFEPPLFRWGSSPLFPFLHHFRSFFFFFFFFFF